MAKLVRKEAMNQRMFEENIDRDINEKEAKAIAVFTRDRIERDFSIDEVLSDGYREEVFLCIEKISRERRVVRYKIIAGRNMEESANFYERCAKDPVFVKCYSFERIDLKDCFRPRAYVIIWVMEYVTGGTIAEIKLDDIQKLEIKNLVATLHYRGLYHGDIARSNIMYGSEFKLIDPYYHDFEIKTLQREDLTLLESILEEE